MTLAEELGITVTLVRDLCGEECWECSKDQANIIARAHRAEAWRIWLSSEIDHYMLATPEQITEVIEKKRQKPGPYLPR